MTTLDDTLAAAVTAPVRHRRTRARPAEAHLAHGVPSVLAAALAQDPADERGATSPHATVPGGAVPDGAVPGGVVP
ncbi:hypothetical protein [Actinomadura luteofluorescens]